MAPKVDTSDPRIQKLLEQFATISFTGQKANETLRNAKTSETLSTLIEKNQLEGKGLDAKKGQLVVSAATVAPPSLDLEKRSYIVQRILDGSLDSADRINEAGKYLASVSDVNSVDKAAFDQACGVGEYLISFLPTQRMRYIKQTHVLEPQVFLLERPQGIYYDSDLFSLFVQILNWLLTLLSQFYRSRRHAGTDKRNHW